MAQAAIVTKAAGEASRALGGDIVRIDTQYFRTQTFGKGKNKQDILIPINVEAHVNPLGIFMGAAALGIAALGSVIAWNGITFRALGGEFTLLEGLKDTLPGKDLAAYYERKRAERITAWEHKKAKEAVQRAIDLGQIDPDLFSTETCTRLQALYNAETNPIMLSSFIRAAQKEGCEWAAELNP